jgi:hypothetical protein
MLVFNHSLLNKGYILMNALKAMSSISGMCRLNVISLSKIIQIFCAIYKRMSRPFKTRRESGSLIRTET